MTERGIILQGVAIGLVVSVGLTALANAFPFYGAMVRNAAFGYFTVMACGLIARDLSERGK